MVSSGFSSDGHISIESILSLFALSHRCKVTTRFCHRVFSIPFNSSSRSDTYNINMKALTLSVITYFLLTTSSNGFKFMANWKVTPPVDKEKEELVKTRFGDKSKF